MVEEKNRYFFGPVRKETDFKEGDVFGECGIDPAFCPPH
jgi:hypothetical protein